MTSKMIQEIAQGRMLDTAARYSNYQISAPRAIATHLFYFAIGFAAATVRR